MSNLKRIVYMENSDLTELIDRGSITKNGRTITYSDNDLYITPDEDKLQIFSSFLDFPQIGEEDKIYFARQEGYAYSYSNTDGYFRLDAPIYTTMRYVAGWDAGEMTTLSVELGEPILNVKNGTLPSLTIETMDVVTDIQPVKVVNE